MPIFEYICDDCDTDHEILVLGSESPACPDCGSTALTKKLSLPKVKSEGTRRLAMRAAKKRDQRMGTERMIERIEYESSHDD